MKTVTIDQRQLPALGIGTWEMGDDPADFDAEIAAIRAGLDAGLKVIDTAEMYGSGRSESLVGQAIQPYKRSDLYLILSLIHI